MTKALLSKAFKYHKNTLHADDTSLQDIAETYGTPCYVYSASQVLTNYRAYENALGSVMSRAAFTICYACKANGNQAILSLLAKAGAGADIVSAGEMARALKAGIKPDKIVFSGVGKTEAEIDLALKSGLRQINAESEPELALISKIAKRRKVMVDVALRINPNVDAKTHAKITTGKKENKFGIDIDLAPALFKRARKLPNIRLSGVAVHIGSQLTSLAPFKRAYTRLAQLVVSLRKAGHDISRVDLGGGIGITYRHETPPDLYMYALMVRDIFAPLNVHLYFEPGRAILGNAGVLLTRVVQIKQGTAKRFVIVDAAMNDLLRPALYDAYHAIAPVKHKAGKAQLCDVVGPVCETGDTFLKDEKLPSLAAGDLVAMLNAGAYGSVMASTYNARPLAGEVLVSGNKHSRIRRAQSVDDLIKQDIVPAWI